MRGQTKNWEEVDTSEDHFGSRIIKQWENVNTGDEISVSEASDPGRYTVWHFSVETEGEYELDDLGGTNKQEVISNAVDWIERNPQDRSKMDDLPRGEEDEVFEFFFEYMLDNIGSVDQAVANELHNNYTAYVEEEDYETGEIEHYDVEFKSSRSGGVFAKVPHRRNGIAKVNFERRDVELEIQEFVHEYLQDHGHYNSYMYAQVRREELGPAGIQTDHVSNVLSTMEEELWNHLAEYFAKEYRRKTDNRNPLEYASLR